MDDIVREINTIVLTVLDSIYLEAWWDTTIPALSLRTPAEVVEDGDLDELLEYVRTYIDSSFS